eukprot:COSAG02_NODE_9764_length_2117_cov_1.835481_1_plen_556_part_01
MVDASHQQGRMAIGLGQVQHAVPINRVLGKLTKQAIPDFMGAAQKVEECGEVPDIVGLAEQILDMAQDAKQFGELKSDPLAVQGVAFMMMYSAEGTDPAFYKVLNEHCYDPDRSKIVPFGEYIVGAVKHMKAIEPYPNSVVNRGVKADLAAQYPKGREVVWHGFCSTTKSIEVLSNPMFCGDSGSRTIFQITLTQGQAREITQYSLVASEDEVLLPPGCRFKVESVLPQGDLTIIQMVELPSKTWIIDLSVPDEPQPQPQTPVGGALGSPPASSAPLLIKTVADFVAACPDIDNMEELREDYSSADEFAALLEAYPKLLKDKTLPPGQKQREKLIRQFAEGLEGQDDDEADRCKVRAATLAELETTTPQRAVAILKLAPTDAEIQAAGWAAIWRQSDGGPGQLTEYGRVFGRMGGLENAVSALRQHQASARVLEHVLHATWVLARDDSNTAKITDLGGIDAVVAAMRCHSGNAAVQQYCAGALLNLAAEPHRGPVVAAGGIDALVTAMRSHGGNADLQQNCAGALFQLTQSEPHQGLVVAAGGIDALVTAMRSHGG